MPRRLPSSRVWKASAMATSFTFLSALSALTAAPLPRPPHPTRPILIRSSPAAWALRARLNPPATPAAAEVFSNSPLERFLGESARSGWSVISGSPWREGYESCRRPLAILSRFPGRFATGRCDTKPLAASQCVDVDPTPNGLTNPANSGRCRAVQWLTEGHRRLTGRTDRLTRRK